MKPKRDYPEAREVLSPEPLTRSTLRRLFALMVLFAWQFILVAQVPQGINYQAVARDAAGNPLASVNLQIRVGILSDTLLNSVVWEELHTQVTTSPQGLFTIAIGSGERQTTSSVAQFSDIDWKMHLYLSTALYYENQWLEMGETRLWSVPYAMSSGDLSGTVSSLEVAGRALADDEALFEVKNADGLTVFAVYNEGVRMYVGEGLTKASKGGFAIGTFDESKLQQDLFIVNRDSVRIFIDENPGKAVKGGFAIGGFDETKVYNQDYLRVSGDSIRMYVSDDPTKAVKGGFAIGSFDESKASINPFTSLTPDNYFIGHRAGQNNTTGTKNSVIGFESAISNTEGSDNVFLGYQSGYSNVLGLNNIFIGSQAGYSNIGEIQTIPYYLAYGSYNMFIGNQAGYSNVSGWTNLFLGMSSGYGNISGSDNTFVGNFSGESNVDGVENVSLGAFSGRANLSGWHNVFAGFYSGNKNLAGSNTFVGSYSGSENVNGESNTIIGNGAGKNSDGSYNVFLGNMAGASVLGNNKLVIDNADRASPLIGGDFAARRVGINRTPVTYTLEVGGTIWANGSTITAGVAVWSDERYKKEITPLAGSLDKILKVEGVSFEWRRSEYPDLNFPEGKQIGVIAQDIEMIFPELIHTDPSGYKSVSYEKLTPILVEAVREQQKIIEKQQGELDIIKAELEAIKALVINSGK
ncbi:MAG: tail fiber domain-containing protein [Bacteroidales bacterium]|nr:tail fiber domain-containing protein [Bacteroidales bacterium]